LNSLFLYCSSRKHPYSPHRRDWNFLRVGGGGSLRPKGPEACLWEEEGGMDIFWNYTPHFADYKLEVDT